MSQAQLDQQAEAVADLLDELPWCDCTGFLVAEDEEEEEPEAASFLQAYDVLVFDGYVTDFMRIVRSLSLSLSERADREDLTLQVTVDPESEDDPNLVPLCLRVFYDGEDAGGAEVRKAVLDALESAARRAVEEWSQEEEASDELEALV